MLPSLTTRVWSVLSAGDCHLVLTHKISTFKEKKGKKMDICKFCIVAESLDVESNSLLLSSSCPVE